MKLLILLVSLGFLALCCQASTTRDYTGYKTFRVWPADRREIAFLKKLQSDADFDFWSYPSIAGKPVDIMVPPFKIKYFHYSLEVVDIKFEIIIEDVQTTIPSEPPYPATRKDGGISFENFERYDTIQAYLRELASKYPKLVRLFTMGNTSESRDLQGIKISTGGNKKGIFVDAGIHAREWIAPATALYLINQLVENESNHGLLDNLDWYVVPVLNPDGYEYTHTTDRFWRKTRSRGTFCDGADANRNFDFHWMEIGASDNECSDIYGGRSAFSELEAQALRNFVTQGIPRDTILLYLSFHSYGEYILHPWGYTYDYPSNRDQLVAAATRAAKAIYAVRGTDYTIGSSANALYPAAGGSDDWMMAVAGVPLSYTVELPGGGSSGFNPPPSEIKGIVEETFEGIKAFASVLTFK